MLAVFIVVGCLAKHLNKRLEAKLAEYVQLRVDVNAGNLFPFHSANQKLQSISHNPEENYAIGHKYHP